MTRRIDYAGRSVRLTEERRRHVLGHPEMATFEAFLAIAIASPEVVVGSRTDDAAFLYYRSADTPAYGAKYFCVVVKHDADDAFVVTAYLTDKVKRGVVLWKRP